MCLTPELRDVARVCCMMGFLVYMFNWIWSREWFHWKSTPPEIFADVFCLFVAVVSFFLREGFFWISGEKMLKRQGSVMNIHTPAPHLHINSFLLLNWSHSVPQMSINDKKKCRFEFCVPWAQNQVRRTRFFFGFLGKYLPVQWWENSLRHPPST